MFPICFHILIWALELYLWWEKMRECYAFPVSVNTHWRQIRTAQFAPGFWILISQFKLRGRQPVRDARCRRLVRKLILVHSYHRRLDLFAQWSKVRSGGHSLSWWHRWLTSLPNCRKNSRIHWLRLLPGQQFELCSYQKILKIQGNVLDLKAVCIKLEYIV